MSRKGIIGTIVTALAGNPEVASSGVPVASSYELQYPVVRPLRAMYSKIVGLGNPRKVYTSLYNVDAELAGTIDRLAAMVRTSYQGFNVRPGETLDGDEEELIKILQEFEREWKIKDQFEAIATNMVLYGDQVYITTIAPKIGLTEFTSLPMEYVTAVSNTSQIGGIGSNTQIFQPNIYVLNEGADNNGLQKEWTKEDYRDGS